MTTVTWLAVVVLGVGSIGVFVFFLRDVPSVLPNTADDEAADDDRPKV